MAHEKLQWGEKNLFSGRKKISFLKDVDSNWLESDKKRCRSYGQAKETLLVFCSQQNQNILQSMSVKGVSCTNQIFGHTKKWQIGHTLAGLLACYRSIKRDELAAVWCSRHARRCDDILGRGVCVHSLHTHLACLWLSTFKQGHLQLLSLCELLILMSCWCLQYSSHASHSTKALTIFSPACSRFISTVAVSLLSEPLVLRSPPHSKTYREACFCTCSTETCRKLNGPGLNTAPPPSLIAAALDLHVQKIFPPNTQQQHCFQLVQAPPDNLPLQTGCFSLLTERWDHFPLSWRKLHYKQQVLHSPSLFLNEAPCAPKRKRKRIHPSAQVPFLW